MNRRSQSTQALVKALLALYCVAACAEESPMNATAVAAESERNRLDLRAPDIDELLTPQQIADMLADTLRQSIEEVEVEGVRARALPSTPDVWLGILAPFWALLNPTQAWRILAPIPPDRARYIGATPPDATSSQREPATGIPRMAGD